MVSAIQPDSSYSTHGYNSGDCGVSSFEPFIGRRHSANLGVEADRDWEQTGPAEGGPVDPKLIPSYGGMWLDEYGVDRYFLTFFYFCRSRYMALTRWSLTDPQELFDVATSRRSTMSRSDRAACYIQYLLDSSLFTEKSSNIVPSKLWPLVKDVRSTGKFA
ncbi:hypothetical protein M9H77_01646 [Catharanthus roseus]|uniref:Uncharacterized protein n=1 Tax=Catharanthus roseus TaxID=4058 RepID=A0ACC0C645_CATRO|nr:hypothetical protein M9H77_01646 [Catharanthus roseus]